MAQQAQKRLEPEQAGTQSIGTPLSATAKKVLLCGSGELGKEVAMALQGLGVEVIALDRYDNAPAMQVAHRSYVLSMLDGKELRPTDLLGLGLLGMQVAFGLGLLVCVASALALMLASPVLDPVRFLSVAAAIVLALAGPLTWAAGRMNPPATWLRALAHH